MREGLQKNLLVGVGKGFQYLVEQGRVSPDYLNTVHGMASIHEVLRNLNADDIDEAKFEAIKNIFLNRALSENDKKSVLATRLMKVASELNTDELLVLCATHDFFDKVSPVNHERDKEKWLVFACKESGLTHEYFVNEAAKSLTDKQLLIQGSLIGPYKLSDLGIAFWQFIQDPTT